MDLANLFVGLLTACIAISGLLVNSSVAYIFYKMYKSPFAYLVVTLAVADCGNLFYLAFWAGPMTIGQFDIAHSPWGYKAGQLVSFFWFLTVYTMLAIAFNRFVAIAFPYRSQLIFTTRNTKTLIGGLTVIAGAHIFPNFWPTCNFYFNPRTYVAGYQNTSCGAVLAKMDLYPGVTITSTIFILNLLTALRVRTVRKRSNLLRNSALALRNYNYRREAMFFAQSAINAVVFELLFISFHVASRRFSTKWGWYFSTTFFWLISNSTNGFVIFGMNRPVRRNLKALLCCGQPLLVDAYQAYNSNAPRCISAELSVGLVATKDVIGVDQPIGRISWESLIVAPDVVFSEGDIML